MAIDQIFAIFVGILAAIGVVEAILLRS